MSDERLKFNPPPGWPRPPDDWTPPKGWTPDPSWPKPPPGWLLWVSHGADPEEVQLPSEADSTFPDESDRDSIQVADGPPVDTNYRIAFLENEVAALRTQLEVALTGSDIVVLDDDRVLQDIGIYRYHHPLENAVAYKERLKKLSGRIADQVRSGSAIEKSEMFTFNNSLAKGRKMTNDLAKLMLRAYNAEADNCLRTLRAGNVVTARKRLEKSRLAIARLGKMMQMQISDQFHDLRLEEIELTADFLMKKKEEREAAREERAQLREERRVAAELAAERERLDKERAHIANALNVLHEAGKSDEDLERRLEEIDAAIAHNDYRAANIKAGYVYVISNRGAFGEGVVKIGLTRRLEPLDRVRELSGASVPFRFDIHALFFSEDAVALEASLHRHFADKRVNHANSRKEFFFASPAQVGEVLASKVGNLLEFQEHAESTEYLQSLRYWAPHHRILREMKATISEDAS